MKYFVIILLSGCASSLKIEPPIQVHTLPSLSQQYNQIERNQDSLRSQYNEIQRRLYHDPPKETKLDFGHTLPPE